MEAIGDPEWQDGDNPDTWMYLVLRGGWEHVVLWVDIGWDGRVQQMALGDVNPAITELVEYSPER